MDEPTLLVQPEVVARKLGVRTALTADQRETIEDAILDATQTVEGYLQRPLTPRAQTVTGLYPRPGYALEDWRAWSVEIDDDYAVATAVAKDDGTYDVTFTVGLDAAQHPDIVRYVRVHAVETVRLDDESGMGKRRVSSMSAEGQSMSWESGRAPSGDAGALPALESLKRHRRLPGAYQAKRPAPAPWPMTSAPVGWDPR